VLPTKSEAGVRVGIGGWGGGWCGGCCYYGGYYYRAYGYYYRPCYGYSGYRPYWGYGRRAARRAYRPLVTGPSAYRKSATPSSFGPSACRLIADRNCVSDTLSPAEPMLQYLIRECISY
jgi:hypothetical protein